LENDSRRIIRLHYLLNYLCAHQLVQVNVMSLPTYRFKDRFVVLVVDSISHRKIQWVVFPLANANVLKRILQYQYILCSPLNFNLPAVLLFRENIRHTCESWQSSPGQLYRKLLRHHLHGGHQYQCIKLWCDICTRNQFVNLLK
jgi:hypothetical protein